ncbi:hypothetical protein PYCCODRAFT_362395 [Trametes coccinea BRFM310]|uniref:Uncharacterized protein n=1 Tax=Trametes coccinea (strain BRFM310) TaxID=1353009 RepID=A0A1Y2J3A9_TRAC3|nr:hypothetical protein PYCCODRAFT_362395 [Trametes coccinea BRFM310]
MSSSGDNIASAVLEQCAAEFSRIAHPEYPRLLKHIRVDAVHPKEGKVGSLAALRIERDKFYGGFLEILDEESDELSSFACTLFDKFGHLKPDLVDNEYLKGTGVWARELDQGPLLYIQDINVPEKWRNNGIASFLLQQVARYPAASDKAWLFAWPAPSDQPGTEEEWKAQKEIAGKLFRNNHYRRVGRTKFVAYASDAAHPSRALAAADDVANQSDLLQPLRQPPPREGPSLRLLPDGSFAWGEHEEQELGERNAATYPLHYMMEASVLGLNVRDIGGAIQAAYKQDPSLAREKDDRGFTPLHAAAYTGNLPATRTLLGLPADSGVTEDLYGRDNVAGRTPLELCEQAMQDTKEMAQTLLGSWPGYSAHAVAVVFLLKRAMGEHIPLTEDEYVASRRLGCTCGQCTDGWLSPKMRYRLTKTAEVQADIMRMSSWGNDFMLTNLALEHLPPEIEANGVSRAFTMAYTAVVQAIRDVLRVPGSAGIPTPDAVEGVLHGQGDQFFQGGGRVEHASDYVLRCAMDQSPLGDGTWDKEQEECAAGGSADAVAYAALPKCDNDLEFIRVAEKLCVSNLDRYRALMVSDAMLSDEDEEEDDDDEDMDAEEN